MKKRPVPQPQVLKSKLGVLPSGATPRNEVPRSAVNGPSQRPAFPSVVTTIIAGITGGKQSLSKPLQIVEEIDEDEEPSVEELDNEIEEDLKEYNGVKTLEDVLDVSGDNYEENSSERGDTTFDRCEESEHDDSSSCLQDDDEEEHKEIPPRATPPSEAPQIKRIENSSNGTFLAGSPAFRIINPERSSSSQRRAKRECYYSG